MTNYVQSLTSHYRKPQHTPTPLSATVSDLLALATPAQLATITVHAKHDAPWLSALADAELLREVPSLFERLALCAEARGNAELAEIHRQQAVHGAGGTDA